MHHIKMNVIKAQYLRWAGVVVEWELRLADEAFVDYSPFDYGKTTPNSLKT